MNNKNYFNSYIFYKNINNNCRLIPFNIKKNDLGITKYFIPISKEWKNSIYAFNYNNIKNIPIYDININNLIKGYFNLYFDQNIISNKFVSSKSRHLSLNKIFVSKAEIKHTNSKAVITIYTYNREKLSLLNKLKKNKYKILNIYKNIYYFKHSNSLIKYLKHNQNINLLEYKNIDLNNPFYKLITFYLLDGNKTLLAKFRYIDILNKCLGLKEFKLQDIYKNTNNISSFFEKISYIFKMKDYLYKKIGYISLAKKQLLKISLNKYKFEERFLYKISELLSKFYSKKVEFNIVNLKSIIFNSDIFTKILTLKIKNKKSNVIRLMNFILNKAILPKVNRIKEKSNLIKSIDLNLLYNKFKNISLSSILKETTIDKLLNEEYYNINLDKNYLRIYDIIFNSIKYKNMGGIRLEVKGRLTKRYRADRALFKIKWKGGLKNIDSSYKGLSSINIRGHVKPNVEYSMFTSKRRIGAFAVKGWISGK